MHVRHERHLSAYIDRELSPDEVAAVDRHLEACEECRAELDRLRGVRALLGALPERPLPDTFWPDLRRRLQAEPRPVSPFAWLVDLRRRPAPALALAAVLLIVLIPLVQGQLDRLRAAEFGMDLFVREHAVTSASDPLADPAYLGLLMTDANLALVGQRRQEVPPR